MRLPQRHKMREVFKKWITRVFNFLRKRPNKNKIILNPKKRLKIYNFVLKPPQLNKDYLKGKKKKDHN